MEADNPPPLRPPVTAIPSSPLDARMIFEAVERQRTELMTVSAVLKCSRFTLVNDPMEEVSPTEHSDVISVAVGLLDGIATKLDSVQLAKDAAHHRG